MKLHKTNPDKQNIAFVHIFNSQIMNSLTPIEKLQAEIAQSQQTLDKLTLQDEKLDSNLKELRQAMEKKLQKQATNGKATATAIDESKIEKQLEKELENAKNKLKQYHMQLKAQARRMANKTNTNTIEDLFTIEEAVKQKDTQIKQLHDQIKQLNNLKRKQQKILQMREKKNQDQTGGKVAKLAEEISGLKDLLGTLQATYAKKKDGLTKKQKQIQQLQQKYKLICSKNNEIPITFQEFKEQRRQRRNFVEDSPNKKQSRKQHMSIKQIISAKDNYDSLEPTQENLQKLKEKRQIAENALKNAKRKHEKEIDQLTKKLEFLQEENGILEGRLKQKQKQKQMVQTRFVEAKKNTIRKLTPLK